MNSTSKFKVVRKFLYLYPEPKLLLSPRSGLLPFETHPHPNSMKAAFLPTTLGIGRSQRQCPHHLPGPLYPGQFARHQHLKGVVMDRHRKPQGKQGELPLSVFNLFPSQMRSDPHILHPGPAPAQLRRAAQQLSEWKCLLPLLVLGKRILSPAHFDVSSTRRQDLT